LAAKEAGEARTILFNLSGHGYFDMAAYDAYQAGRLVNHEHPQAQIEESLKRLPQVG
jgi:tryptophan synthase beta chain